MPIDPQGIDVDRMSAEEFVGLVKSCNDNELRAAFRGAGTAQALDRIFAMMTEYYRPERAGDVDATVQWRITDDGEDHHYFIRFTSTRCETARGESDDATTWITTDLARFARIVVGQANAVKLLMTRKLKASGDVLFARKIEGFFDLPVG